MTGRYVCVHLQQHLLPGRWGAMEPHDIATLSLSMCLDPVIAVQGEEGGGSVFLPGSLSVSLSEQSALISLQVGSPVSLRPHAS